MRGEGTELAGEGSLRFLGAGDEADDVLGGEGKSGGVGRNEIGVPVEEQRGEKGGEELRLLGGLEEQGGLFGERLLDAPGGAEAAEEFVAGGFRPGVARADPEESFAGLREEGAKELVGAAGGGRVEKKRVRRVEREVEMAGGVDADGVGFAPDQSVVVGESAHGRSERKGTIAHKQRGKEAWKKRPQRHKDTKGEE